MIHAGRGWLDSFPCLLNIFRINSFYLRIKRKLNAHSNIEYLLYEVFILLILPAIYFEFILDYFLIVLITFALYLLIYSAFDFIPCFKFRRKRRESVGPFINLKLGRLRLSYLPNSILSKYLVILGITLIFYL